jgi:adenylate kinase
MLNIVLFGPPGAGKGTQSELMRNEFSLIHLSTGDILRNEIRNGTTLGMEAKKLMDEGQLVPDSVVIGMIRNKLKQHRDAAGFIFDGFPRTQAQAVSLDKLLHELGAAITTMISLEVPERELVKRLLERGKSSGRSDDQNEEVIKGRLDVYEKQTAVLKNYYQKQGKLQSINGVGTVEEVFGRIEDAVNQANG